MEVLRGQLRSYLQTSEGRLRPSLGVIIVLTLSGTIGMAEIAQEKTEEV